MGHVSPEGESGEGNAVHPPPRASAVRAREVRATGDDRGGDGPVSEAVRAAIPLGVAAIVVVFAAIGLEGEVLSRFIRTNPLQVTVAFTLAIVLPTRSSGLLMRYAGRSSHTGLANPVGWRPSLTKS